MQTPDGQWRVEIYRRPRTRNSYWYRLINVPGDNVIDDLTITGVQRLLTEAGVDIADLVDVADSEAADNGEQHGVA
jgi:bifunctional non-homologous end joining protein LigD